MTPLTPAMSPAGMNPLPQAQTPQSQYLAAALKQLGALQPTTGAAVAEGLGSTALLNYAQQQAGKYGQDGTNAQKNATSDQLAAVLGGAGIAPATSATLPTQRPGGLLGLGSLFGGSNGG